MLVLQAIIPTLDLLLVLSAHQVSMQFLAQLHVASVQEASTLELGLSHVLFAQEVNIQIPSPLHVLHA